jgi:hypothetical protein
METGNSMTISKLLEELAFRCALPYLNMFKPSFYEFL